MFKLMGEQTNKLTRRGLFRQLGQLLPKHSTNKTSQIPNKTEKVAIPFSDKSPQPIPPTLPNAIPDSKSRAYLARQLDKEPTRPESSVQEEIADQTTPDSNNTLTTEEGNNHYLAGQKFKNELVKALAVSTDPTGKVLKHLTAEQQKEFKKWGEEWKGKEAEYFEKYGGCPSVIQLVLEELDKADKQPAHDRRRFLFGSDEKPGRGPKEMVKDGAKSLSTLFIPWPIRTVLNTLGFKL